MAMIADMPLRARLNKPGLVVQVGPVAARISGGIAGFSEDFQGIYGPYPAAPEQTIAAFTVDLAPSAWWRRWLRPDVVAYCDIRAPFIPLPADLAMVGAEMGLNWQIAMGMGRFLLVHGAVVADAQDRAIVLPGASGSGKSTLAAALGFCGWRLLADEFVLIDPKTRLVHPYPRPISLKNEAVAAMRAMAPHGRYSRVFSGTNKGDIVYLTPPEASLAAMDRPARIKRILFPAFEAGAAPGVGQVDPGELLILMISASANYVRTGEAGFAAMTELAARVPAARLRFGSTRDGIALVEKLAS